MNKQQRLDELMAEYEKKEALLQILPNPKYKSSYPPRWVVEKQRVVYKKLESAVEELKKLIEAVFYGEEE